MCVCKLVSCLVCVSSPPAAALAMKSAMMPAMKSAL